MQVSNSKVKTVLHFLPRWDNGGMEHEALDIIKNFSVTTFRHTIFTGSYENEFALKEMQDHGIQFNYPENVHTYSFLKVLIEFHNYLSVNQFDIVHCHINNSIGLIFTWIAKLHGTKAIVAHTHNNNFGEGKIQIKNMLRKISLALFSNVPSLYFACSEDAGRWTFGESVMCREDYHVIYNGINTELFRYSEKARKELRKQYALENQFIVGHIGHFNYQKNQAFLLDIFPKLREEVPNVHMFLIGAGETKNGLMEIAKNMDDSNFITFIDPVTDVARYYSMFDLFLLPSHFEGFGIVAVEAQLTGLDVICSDAVPKVTAISDHIKYLPVSSDENKAQWIQYIKEKEASLRIRYQDIDVSRYDIKKLSSLVEKGYVALL